MRINFKQVSIALPKEAAMMLVKAAMIDQNLDAGMSRDRTIAIDNAVARIKREYPNYFK
jgi:hypothetical protein